MSSPEKLMERGFLSSGPKIPLPSAKKAKGRNKAYPEEFKIKALVLLKKNEYRLLDTATQLKLPVKTLSAWRDKFGIQVFREDEKLTQVLATKNLNGLVEKSKIDLDALTSQIFENASQAEIELIKRIRTVAKDSSNLDHLARCLKIMHEIVTGKEENKGPAVSQPANSYYQLVMSQIIKVQEDIQWKMQQEQEQLNQSKSLPPLPLQG